MAGNGRIRWVGNLPAETTSFVGRKDELARLEGVLARSRLVTLTGVGGVGKSRLALRAADAARAEFPDGVWLVELSPVRDGMLLAATAVEALSLSDQGGRPLREVLGQWLVDKRLLLVLDTCEHVAADCAELLLELLAVAPGLKVLATSRQPLGLDAEDVMELRPLSVPGEVCDTESAESAESEALQLFRERAAAASPGFTLTGPQRGPAAELCRRLDGIPLAIELAAARLGDWPVDELASRISGRLDLLAASGTTELPRHRTMLTAIGWSHELCRPLERLLWARLSVFAGGFDLDTAQMVCARGPLPAGQIPGLLEELVAKSIVLREHRAGRERYCLLDTLREYGTQWLVELGEDKDQRRRHAEHYLRLARRGAAEWIGPDQVEWSARLTAEHADVRAALEYHLVEGEPADALAMAGALWFFWMACGFLREGRHYLERALALECAPGPERDEAFWAHGVLTLIQGDQTAGLRTGEECLAAARGRDDPDAAYPGIYLVGASRVLMGDCLGALEALQWRATPPRNSRYRGIWLLIGVSRGFALVGRGELDAAAAEMDTLRREHLGPGEQWIRAFAAYVQALADLGRGRIAPAIDHARAALSGKAVLRDVLGLAMTVDLLASATAAAGEGARPARLLGIGERCWRTVGSPQYGSVSFAQARRACEQQVRGAIGDTAFEAEFRRGLEYGREEGLDYALTSDASPGG